MSKNKQKGTFFIFLFFPYTRIRDVKVRSENCGSYDFSWAGACGRKNFPPSAGDAWDFFAYAGESVRKIKILEKFLKIFSIKFCGRKREKISPKREKKRVKKFFAFGGRCVRKCCLSGWKRNFNFFSMHCKICLSWLINTK